MSGHPFEFIFGGPPDPEQQAQMQRAHDTAVMQQQSLRHEVQSFVDDLNEDGLRVLRAIVHASAGDENYGAFVQGAITTMLHIKYNLCAACGENHDRALLGGTEVDDGTEQPAMDEPSPAEQAAAVADKMEEYNVRFVNDSDRQKGLVMMPGEQPVFCRECDSLFQSLEDRMLRPPGVKGCEGCQHKAKWG